MEIVCGWKLTAGSNPVLCAKQKRYAVRVLFLFGIPNFEQDLRVGAVLREQNALPCKTNRRTNYICLSSKLWQI